MLVCIHSLLSIALWCDKTYGKKLFFSPFLKTILHSRVAKILYLKPLKTQLVQELFSYKYQLDTLSPCTNKRPLRRRMFYQNLSSIAHFCQKILVQNNKFIKFFGNQFNFSVQVLRSLKQTKNGLQHKIHFAERT